jgi:phage FluMu protein Com
MVSVPIKVRCTFCDKELKANSVDGVKVLDEKCDCAESREYFKEKEPQKITRVRKKDEVEIING